MSSHTADPFVVSGRWAGHQQEGGQEGRQCGQARTCCGWLSTRRGLAEEGAGRGLVTLVVLAIARRSMACCTCWSMVARRAGWSSTPSVTWEQASRPRQGHHLCQVPPPSLPGALELDGVDAPCSPAWRCCPGSAQTTRECECLAVHQTVAQATHLLTEELADAVLRDDAAAAAGGLVLVDGQVYVTARLDGHRERQRNARALHRPCGTGNVTRLLV